MSLKLTSYKGTRDLYPVDMAERRYIFDGWRATRHAVRIQGVYDSAIGAGGNLCGEEWRGDR